MLPYLSYENQNRILGLSLHCLTFFQLNVTCCCIFICPFEVFNGLVVLFGRFSRNSLSSSYWLNYLSDYQSYFWAPLEKTQSRRVQGSYKSYLTTMHWNGYFFFDESISTLVYFCIRSGGDFDIMSRRVAATNGYLKNVFVDALREAV